VHTLFDRGYLAVDSRHRLLVSPRLRGDFGNGDQFYARGGEVIELPERRPTGRTAASWNGTSMKSSRPRSVCLSSRLMCSTPN
jgi:putative restriction endonuclease